MKWNGRVYTSGWLQYGAEVVKVNSSRLRLFVPWRVAVGLERQTSLSPLPWTAGTRVRPRNATQHELAPVMCSGVWKLTRLCLE